MGRFVLYNKISISNNNSGLLGPEHMCKFALNPSVIESFKEAALGRPYLPYPG